MLEAVRDLGSMETLVCLYPDEERASAAREAGFTRIGDATGIAMASGRMLLVVVDRKKQDTSGRTLNRIAEQFRQKVGGANK